VTLWPISDAEAADFMADFHRNWLEGNAQDGPADALRATQIDWISSGEPTKADPRHWAAYVLIERR
jgi:CHAT domain-containing protein